MVETKAIIDEDSVNTVVQRKMNSSRLKSEMQPQTLPARNLFNSGNPVVAPGGFEVPGNEVYNH